MNYRRFYRELGRMLYAIASADGKVEKREWDKFHAIVKEQIQPLEGSSDEYGTDNSWYAEFEFELLEEAGADPQASMRSFLHYLKDHKEYVNDQARALILTSADAVAQSFYGENRKEQEMFKLLEEGLMALEA